MRQYYLNSLNLSTPLIDRATLELETFLSATFKANSLYNLTIQIFQQQQKMRQIILYFTRVSTI